MTTKKGVLKDASGNVLYPRTTIDNVLGAGLSQATDTKLGGIKASPKTAEETQEVKIDTATGKLFTKAGGGGGVSFYNPFNTSFFIFTPDSSNNSFSLRSVGDNKIKVDWGDGTKEEIGSSTVVHTYKEPFKETIVFVEGTIGSFEVNLNCEYACIGNLEKEYVNDLFRLCTKLRYVKIFSTKKISTWKDTFGLCSKLTKVELYVNTTGGNTQFNQTFNNCKELIEAPYLDLSSCTECIGMFQGCEKLMYCPCYQTSKCKYFANLFDDCKLLVEAPYLDLSSCMTTSYMFHNCVSLLHIPNYNTGNVVSMDYMLSSCNSLIEAPYFDTRKVTSAVAMFYLSKNIKIIPAYDFISATTLDYMFNNCTNLEEINMININANLDIHWSTKMQQPALHKLIDNLVKQNGTTKKLTLGATLLARVSEEYKQKAKDKGWTLA